MEDSALTGLNCEKPPTVSVEEKVPGSFGPPVSTKADGILAACRNRISEPFHILTVDVEDWPQSTLDHSLPIGNRVVANTHAVLELLEHANVQATFFVLGKVAEAHPELSRDIVAQGHEVSTHGYSHEPVEKMPMSLFRKELHRSVDLLRQQTGKAVMGHRAADFSISSRSLHLLECLVEEGLRYDSSIFPIRHPRYGIPGAWREPHLVRSASKLLLAEFPVATLKLHQLTLPAAGGGYLRLFPYWVTKTAMGRIEKEGLVATCYLHPYELDTSEKDHVPCPIPLRLRWTQFTNRRSVRSKLVRLLKDFRFIPMARALKLLQNRLEVALDLGRQPITYGNAL